ncbi:helix-turn-helix domain-containing protein [Caedibacter taeniospiralis]|uniref:helix-turn-helix domain-containing protein n=1 Tax=Caedibacter taeniospiralis TaxID=28907 RepID=UPI000C274068|nr:helix-turn-helix domain-containing protein [Caedibacter taeniospiralis]
MAATMHYKLKPNGDSAETFPLREVVRKRVQHYYRMVAQEGLSPESVYELLMEETECPLLEATMAFTGGNQSRSARILGLNRGTFRKKLEQYNMLDSEEESPLK